MCCLLILAVAAAYVYYKRYGLTFPPTSKKPDDQAD